MAATVAQMQQDYYTSTEQRQMTADQIAQTLSGAGLNFTSEQILAGTRQDGRNAIDMATAALAADPTSATAQAQYVAVMKVSKAYATLNPTLDQHNQALADAKKALADAKKAADGAAKAISGGGGGGGGGGGSSLVGALRGLTDAIYDEVNRIKGLVAGDSLMGYAEAQAAFAIGTASARSGNQEALKALPQLSQNMLQLAESNATSLQELNYIRGTTAASLLTTAGMNGGLPSFDVGTDYVPQDMNARIHKGEKITPAKYNNNDSELAGLLTAIWSKLEEVVTELEEIKGTNKRISDITEKSDTIGPAPARAVA